jgi:hypothetical protein
MKGPLSELWKETRPVQGSWEARAVQGCAGHCRRKAANVPECALWPQGEASLLLSSCFVLHHMSQEGVTVIPLSLDVWGTDHVALGSWRGEAGAGHGSGVVDWAQSQRPSATRCPWPLTPMARSQWRGSGPWWQQPFLPTCPISTETQLLLRPQLSAFSTPRDLC